MLLQRLDLNWHWHCVFNLVCNALPLGLVPRGFLFCLCEALGPPSQRSLGQRPPRQAKKDMAICDGGPGCPRGHASPWAMLRHCSGKACQHESTCDLNVRCCLVIPPAGQCFQASICHHAPRGGLFPCPFACDCLRLPDHVFDQKIAKLGTSRMMPVALTPVKGQVGRGVFVPGFAKEFSREKRQFFH